MTPGVSKHILLQFIQSLNGADCHMALLKTGARIDADTFVFDGTGEAEGSGYAAGGKRLQGFSCGLDNGTAWAAWNSVDWMNASIKAKGAVIYAKAWGNKIVAVLEFDEEKSSSQALFRVRMPAPGSQGAIFGLT